MKKGRGKAAALFELDRLQGGAVALQPVLAALGVRAKLLAQLPEFRPVVHLLEMRDLVRNEVVDDGFRRHHDTPGEGQLAGRGAGTPAARRVSEAYRLGTLVDGAGVLEHQRLNVLLGLFLQEISQAARKMLTFAVDEKGGRAVLLP